MIRQEVLDRIREQTDIVELISNYVPLRRVGRNYRGLCPFHAERSPSFYVSQERQSYHCFGCGAGGTAISFVMAQEKLEFPEAVRFLAAKLGIQVDVEKSVGRNQPLYDACEQAAKFYEEQLGKSETGKAYLERRGMREDVIQRFRLGFAPEGNALRGAARRRGLNEEALVGAGLLVRRTDGYGDYFRGRIMFPVFSLSGKVVGFSGRVLGNDEPKYLNSPDTPIFRKGDVLYGLFQAKGYIRNEVPIMVEGNFDLLSLAGCGINRVVAPLGTALTQNQALLIRRYNSQVLLCFDGDEAGQRACRRALEVFLGAGVDPQIVALPPGVDPDALIRAEGRQAFLARLERAKDFVEFLTATVQSGTIAERRRMLSELAALLRLVPDELSIELYANKIARLHDVDKKLLFGRAPMALERRAVSPRSSGIETKLVAAMVHSAELAQVALEVCLSEALVDERLQRIARLVEECCERPGYGPGMLMDLVEDDETRKLVASLTFGHGRQPGPDEFYRQVVRYRAAWLMRRIEAAHKAGEEETAEELGEERSRLLRGITRKGVHVDEG
uniref:DNA primase n=1 Tax=candidate division WOR-3 bacterium TaxID=2052148 RepID=A0A7C4G9X8_UNCW3